MTGVPTWTCPTCGAPFANRNASHSCVEVTVDTHFRTADPAVRAAFDRLAQVASTDAHVLPIAQKTRIVFAAPMRFLAVMVRRDRLTGHVLHERSVSHRLVDEIVPDAYGSGLFLHRFSIHEADEIDDKFATLVREAARRVGRRERLASRPTPSRGR